jgi:hypothetical protein
MNAPDKLTIKLTSFSHGGGCASFAGNTGVVIYYKSKSPDAEVRKLQAAGFAFNYLHSAGKNHKNPPWRVKQ